MHIGLLTLLSTAQADMTLSLDSLSADGLEVRALSCTLKQGGLLASAMVVGALAAQKSVFDACAPEGGAFRLSWSWEGATTVQQVSGGSPTQQECITAALQVVSPPTLGHCSAILLAGSPAEAAAAAEALQRDPAAQP